VGAVFLAEEAGADKRTVGRAVIGCVSVAVTLYLLTSFAYVSGLSLTLSGILVFG